MPAILLVLVGSFSCTYVNVGIGGISNLFILVVGVFRDFSVLLAHCLLH
jgi:hypothetical protein